MWATMSWYSIVCRDDSPQSTTLEVGEEHERNEKTCVVKTGAKRQRHTQEVYGEPEIYVLQKLADHYENSDRPFYQVR